MIPIADESPRRYVPVINYLLIVINIVAFFYQPVDPEAKKLFFNSYGLIPSNVSHFPPDFLVYTSIFSSMFIHADIMHLLGNLLYLWIFGDNIEYVLGHLRYFVFYIVVGIGAALMQILFIPESSIPMIGASGAISGVLGAYLVKFPRNRVSILLFFIIIIRIIKVPAVLAIGLWVLFQLYNLYFSGAGLEQGGVAWFAHIGGFISGFILIKLFEWYPRYT
jgi:membrane associated rhomboid family serine protease